MIIPLLLLMLLYFLFRNRSKKIKKLIVFLVAFVNMLQHLFKPYIYPQYFGESFSARCTAYNMCALLILISPIVLLIGSELWKNFLFYVGSIAGASSILVTYWLASSVEEQIRFVICHGLLFVSSFLPMLFGLYKINYRKFWKLPFVFFTCLMILIVNNIVNFILGIVGDVGSMTLDEFLIRENPCWSMGPPADYPFVLELIKPFTPEIFLGGSEGVFTPIMWYAFPMIIIFWSVGLVFGIILDAKRFFGDFAKLFCKRKQRRI